MSNGLPSSAVSPLPNTSPGRSAVSSDSARARTGRPTATAQPAERTARRRPLPRIAASTPGVALGAIEVGTGFAALGPCRGDVLAPVLQSGAGVVELLLQLGKLLGQLTHLLCEVLLGVARLVEGGVCLVEGV